MARKPGPRGRAAKGLTRRQEAFAQHYAVHRNASEAYRSSYPRSRKWKPEALYSRASRLLKHAKVNARVEQLQNRVQAIVEERFDVTVEKVVQGLAAIAFADPANYYIWGTGGRPVFGKDGKPIVDEKTGQQVKEPVPFVVVKPSSALTKTQRAAITGVEVTLSRTGERIVSVRLGDRRAALRDLGQHLGLFERTETAPVHNHVSVHIETPDFAAMGDRREALRKFEDLRRRLAEDAVLLPAPAPAANGKLQ